MKKIFGFLGAMALCVFAGCSNEDLTGSGNNQGQPSKGDLHMTLNISQASVMGTRTSTPDQGVEQGKDAENKISKALLIVADEASKIVSVVNIVPGASGKAEIVTSTDGTTHTAKFQLDRQVLQEKVTAANGSYEFKLFMIANPTDDIVKLYTETKKAGADVQDVFTLAAEDNENKFWSPNNFLMSSADWTKKTITDDDIKEGMHTTADNPLNLGTIKVQRDMSRFDLATDDPYTVFNTNNGNTELGSLVVSFDGVALINMATTANMFKEVGNTPGDKAMFVEEEVNNYVFSPNQTTWRHAMYSVSNAAIQTGTCLTFDNGNLTYTSISDLKGNDDDNEYTHPGTTKPSNVPDYKIWRYCMPNTNYDKANQKHGNTTGVVFRAEITGSFQYWVKKENPAYSEDTKTEEPQYIYESASKEINDKLGTVLYAYNNTIYGDLEGLTCFVEGGEPKAEAELYEYTKVKLAYENAMAGITTDDAKLIEEALVKNGFTIYRPDKSGKYMCYYIYWNRHNDNNNPGLMGPTEFATVRNNVYKLSVNKITRLGRPVNPSDDPEPDEPGTDDENDKLWGDVVCRILPWEVRVNGIEF